MNYLSVCSGIEAASVAWAPLGWSAVAFSEIEKFPSAVLVHHYPTVPNLGDMTKFKGWNLGTIDLMVGGTPCQSFSVAGLRKGLADPRGNLMLTYLAIAEQYRPKWLVWENVPGVLSSNGGNDFACLLRGLAELGYGFAYRILDAQYHRVAQRRRRVFVVGHFGDWRRAAAVLFERHSLQGNPAPSREKRQDIAGTIDASLGRSRGAGTSPAGIIEIAHSLRAQSQSSHRADTETYIPILAPCLTIGTMCMATGQAGAEIGADIAPTLNCNHEAPIAFDCKASGQNGFGIGRIASTLRSMGHANSHQNGGGHQAVAYTMDINKSDNMGSSQGVQIEHSNTLRTEKVPAVIRGMRVRRLTPRECERLQGFPDDYTQISRTEKASADGPRYKALGNSMAVPCMNWIGRRIQQVESLRVAA